MARLRGHTAAGMAAAALVALGGCSHAWAHRATQLRMKK
jgi:L-serine deaminase